MNDNIVYSYAARAQIDLPNLHVKAGDILHVVIERDTNPAHPPHEDEPILFDLPRDTGIGDRDTIDWYGGYSHVEWWLEVPIACRIVGGYKIVRLADEFERAIGYVFAVVAYTNVRRLVNEALWSRQALAIKGLEAAMTLLKMRVRQMVLRYCWRINMRTIIELLKALAFAVCVPLFIWSTMWSLHFLMGGM